MAIPVSVSTAMIFIGAGAGALGFMAAMGVLLFLGVRAGVNALVKAARKRNERKRIRKMLDKSEQKKWRYSDEDTAGDPDEDQEAAEPADTDKGSADQEAAEKEEEKDE